MHFLAAAFQTFTLSFRIRGAPKVDMQCFILVKCVGTLSEPPWYNPQQETEGFISEKTGQTKSNSPPSTSPLHPPQPYR